MWKFIVVTFGVLGFMLYEMSGGPDFVPEERPRDTTAQIAPRPDVTADEILANLGDQAPEDAPAIALREDETPSLASTAQDALDTVTARLARPLIAEADGDPSEVSFVSLSVSPDGTTTAPADTALDATIDRAADGTADGTSDGAGYDIRSVDVAALNVRAGPSTSDDVIGRLFQFDSVSVLEEASDGWAHIRIEGDGIEGWVASRFLTE